ncbi:MAG: NAD(P)-dependent alcohol dehydrogenase [Deltaproteobacteria bacterium]|nr:NAD(P)-dependent alcohol dehydrogenase [Deltaproteobacteria bacterium]
MRAVHCPAYGPPETLEIREVPRPSPGPREILVRTLATTVTSGDWRVQSGTFPRGFGLLARLVLGVRGPRQPILGTELSGIVEGVGAEVTRFRVGDEVVAFTDASMGCHVEGKCFPEDGPVVKKPARLSFAEAAALSFGGTTALDVFRRAGLAAEDEVLVNGASGGVGTAAVQLAKAAGARVTAVCSAENAALARSLGADRVIDYRTLDFTTDPARYDIVVDVVGTAPYARSRQVLKPGGRVVLVLASLGENLAALWEGRTAGHRVIAGPVSVRPADLAALAALAETGKLRVVIDDVVAFEDIAAAYRRVATGRKRGALVVAVDPSVTAPRG